LLLPGWLYITLHAVLPLLAIVMMAVPAPEPVQLPLVVMATVKPELAVAATLNVELYAALDEAGVVTVIVCAAFVAFVVDVTCGAAAYVPLPAWLYITVHAVVPLVIVTVPPAIEQPPLVVIATARPEFDVAATGKVALKAALSGAAVVTVIVCVTVEGVVELLTCVAAL